MSSHPGITARTPTSVVLCTRNCVTTVGLQLDALAAQDDTVPWELVVVDNGSTDGTAELLRRRCAVHGRWRLVTAPVRGLNRARNAAVAAAVGDVFLFCDADDVVAPDWVRRMRVALAAADVVGGRLDVHRLNRTLTAPGPTVQEEGLPEVLGFRYAAGASLGSSRRVVEQLDGFDESFTAGYDEVDLCVRAQLQGFSIGFVPDAVVHYRLRPTVRGVAVQHFGYGRGHQQFVTKLARTGVLHTDARTEWVSVLRRLAVLAVGCRAACRSERRRGYVASVAFNAGRLTQLATGARPPATATGRSVPPRG